MAVETSYSMN